MKTCILHYAIMDSDGNLSIDCKRHNTLEEAKTAQANLNNRFKELAPPDNIIIEECGTFNRLVIKDNLAKIQSQIE